MEKATTLRREPENIAAVDAKALVLLSGGVDSAACLAFLNSLKIHSSGLFVDYGHSAGSQEHRAALDISEFYRAPLKQIAVSGFQQWGAGFVPGRNAFLLHTALMAVDFNNGIVVIGIHAGTSYSDCSDLFLKQMQSSFDVYTGGRISVSAPFLHWTKAEIWEYCRRMKVPIELTYSCEVGHERPCGRCLSCVDRGLLI